MTDVVIHTHPPLPLRPNYLAFQPLELWRHARIRVEIIAGSAAAPSVRLGILHVDLARVVQRREAGVHADVDDAESRHLVHRVLGVAAEREELR